MRGDRYDVTLPNEVRVTEGPKAITRIYPTREKELQGNYDIPKVIRVTQVPSLEKPSTTTTSS